jgi:putative Mn2+ efflux pump MntP
MGIIEIVIIAVGLAMDAFSVSISAGMAVKEPDAGHYFRLSFHFGLFQFMMPVIGYFAGMYIEQYIRNYDHWVAFMLLAFIGSRMIYEAFSGGDESKFEARDPSRGMTLIVLSVATSIDALAVGLSLGVLGREILVPSVIIGVTCALFSIAGVFIGKKAGALAGRRAEALGGVMLVFIGVKILADHMGWW